MELLIRIIMLLIITGLALDNYQTRELVEQAEAESREVQIQKEQTEIILMAAEDLVRGQQETIRQLVEENGDLNGQLQKKPFKPVLGLTPEQNKLCLAIVLYTETSGEPDDAKETMGWAIVNRAIDGRKNNFAYANNVCGVAAAKVQYSGMGPYLTDIADVVWGRITSFVPAKTKKSSLELASWNKTLEIANNIIDGKLTRKTTATHFISFRGMKTNRFPSWVGAYMPVNTFTASGLHVLFRDYGFDRKTGEKVYFTKAAPYNPMKHR